MDLGRRYKELRQTLKDESGNTVSIKALAEKMELAASRISELENNKREMSLTELKAYHKYFKVSFEYLLGETDIQSANEDIQTVCKVTGLTEESVNIILAIKSCPEYLTENQRKVYTNQTPIETFNAIIEAINYEPDTLFRLNQLVNFKYSFKGERAFEEQDITIFEAFKCAFPEAEKFLNNKAVFITNESYANIIENQIQNDFKHIVSCVKDTYNPTPFKLKHHILLDNMKEEKIHGDTLLSRVENEKKDYEFRMNYTPLEDDDKEYEEYMKTPEYKEREKNGELEWFEYPDEISKVKYRELIDQLIKISTEEEADENADDNKEG